MCHTYSLGHADAIYHVAVTLYSRCDLSKHVDAQPGLVSFSNKAHFTIYAGGTDRWVVGSRAGSHARAAAARRLAAA